MADAGKYRTLISIDRTQPETNASGGTVDVWSSWLARRAKVRVAGVRDQQSTDTQNVVLITHVVELRRDSLTATIKQEMRVRVLSRVVDDLPRILHIESIVDGDDKGTELQLRCTERAVPK
jgi:head-tail adaptor